MAKKYNLDVGYNKLSESDKNRIGWASTMLQIGRVRESRKFYNGASRKGQMYMNKFVEEKGDKKIKQMFKDSVELE